MKKAVCAGIYQLKTIYIMLANGHCPVAMSA